MLANALFWQNNLCFNLCLILLYCIVFYKQIDILRCYRKTKAIKTNVDKQSFDNTYHSFRVKVALFWIAFVVCCIIGKYLLHIKAQYFYSCTFFFLFLDKVFVNMTCLLKKLCDLKGTTVLCCCGCPCRGWDLLMIQTPLLFALDFSLSAYSFLIILSSILAIFTFIQWEKQRYSLVRVMPKCAKSCDLKLCLEYRSKYK